MKVFISWSGERSQAVAKALREWIPDVLQSVVPWMSHEDIAAGARWGPAISKELGETHFGIVCLTPENLTAPWIHFEAGAVAKQVDQAFVCPYLLGLTPEQVPQGPLSQFNAKRANREDTLALLETLNSATNMSAVEPDRLRRMFDRSWPTLEDKLKTLPVSSAKPPARSSEDMLGEILELVRNISRGPGPAASFLGALGLPEQKLFLGDVAERLIARRPLASLWDQLPHREIEGGFKATGDSGLCPICGQLISEGETFVVRSSDSARVHERCWAKSRGGGS